MGFLRFLSSLRTLAKNGDITIRDAYKFAQQEFGEVSDLLKLQINKIFKDADAPSIRKPENKNNVFTFVPKDKLRPAQMEEATGIESLKNPYRIGGGLDPVEGMTRTAARVVLDRKGIKVPEKGDPIDVFEENFGGDALMDLKEAGEELLEKETTGRITESMGEFLESKGLFDLKVDKTLPKGMTNEELLKKLMDEDPEEFAKGGRVGYEDGGPTKDEYGIMSLPSVPSNPNSVNDDIDRVAQLVAQSYKMSPEAQMNNKQIAYDRIEEIAEQISYGGNIDGVRSNLMDYFNDKVQEYQSMIQEFSTGGRVGFAGGGAKKGAEGIESLIEMINKKFGKGTIKTADEMERPESAKVKQMMDDFMERNPDPNKQMTDEEIAQFLDDYGVDLTEEYITDFDGTLRDAMRILKEQEDYEAAMYRDYQAGRLDPQPGEKGRKEFLEQKLEEMEMSGDKKLMTRDEIEELSNMDLEAEMNVSKSLAPKMVERLELKQKYPGITDELLDKILIDDNMQRKAEVLATIDEAFKMLEKGMGHDEVLDTLKNVTRTKQAGGGLAYLMGL